MICKSAGQCLRLFTWLHDIGLMNNLSDDATIYVKNKNEFDALVGMADSIPAAYKGKIKFVYDRISHEENSVKLFSDRNDVEF